mmetsp:Transcript_9319/g.21026  ORF Transcript_9319/g.21026 Transcript_9319/m.21026 type:complete len:203 (-) Transcript_9319:150-758(-)
MVQEEYKRHGSKRDDNSKHGLLDKSDDNQDHFSIFSLKGFVIKIGDDGHGNLAQKNSDRYARTPAGGDSSSPRLAGGSTTGFGGTFWLAFDVDVTVNIVIPRMTAPRVIVPFCDSSKERFFWRCAFLLPIRRILFRHPSLQFLLLLLESPKPLQLLHILMKPFRLLLDPLRFSLYLWHAHPSIWWVVGCIGIGHDRRVYLLQ